MPTYYMRADGTAANKEAAITASSAGGAMNLSVHNGETFKVGTTIILSPSGGDFRALSGAVLVPPSSGSEQFPITYKADPDNSSRPLVSGAADLTDTSTYKWTASGSGTNEYYVDLLAGGDPSLSDPNNLYMDKVRLVEGTVGSLNDHEWAYGDNDTLGYSTVYVRDDTDDPDTSGVQIEAPQANNALNINRKDGIIVEGIDFEGGKSNAVIMAAPEYVTMRDCRCRYSINGLLIFDSGDVVGNEILIDSNEFSSNVDAGVSVLEENNNLTLSNNVCFNNTRVGTNGGNVGGINVKSDDGKQSDGVKILSNICYSNGSASTSAATGFGFYIDTLGTSCEFKYNIAYGNRADGVVYEWTDFGDISYNVCYLNERHGFAFIRRCNSNNIYNNTSWGNGVNDSSGSNYIFNGVGEGPTYTESNNLIKNNIGFEAQGKEIRVAAGWVNDGTNGSGNVYDTNIFADHASGQWHNWNGTLYDDADAWQAAATGVSNTSGSDPLVVNASASNFRLKGASPAINAGLNLGIKRDIEDKYVPQGPLPDLGAYEYIKPRAFAPDGSLGVSLSGADQEALHRIGTTIRLSDNRAAIYVYANEAIASGTGVELGASFTASASAGGELTSIYAIDNGEYGWVTKTDITISS